MSARFTHVSVHAPDLEASLRFYQELFGLERLPAPDFSGPVAWLRVGDLQLHLFRSDDPAPRSHHFGIHVDDFHGVYERARALGAIDRPDVRVLPDGAAQLYLRDPAGNRVEVNHPDASALDPEVIGELTPLARERPQSAQAQRARLYLEPRG